MNKTADIVIIGGGVSGVAIGYYLLKHGAKNVVLLERDYLAAGATGRCGAGIRQQWGSPLNCIMSKFSCEVYENAKEELGYPGSIEFHQGGYMLLISNQRELEQMKKNITVQNSLGIDSKLLSTDDAKKIIPILSTDNLLGATYYQKDGHLNPFNTVQAFAEAFKRLGGSILTNVNVTHIAVENDRVCGVDTNQGYIATEAVVSAGGGYTQQIAALAGLELPLYSERHNILVTEPLEPILSTMVMSMSLNFYCQQVPHGSFIMGRSCENQPRDLRITADSHFPEAMAKTITDVMPPLANLRVLRQWAGLYNISPDKHPVYDRVIDGYYVAAGFSGHGFMMAPATGQSMAEIILGLEPTLPWEQLGLGRFETNELLIEPLVV